METEQATQPQQFVIVEITPEWSTEIVTLESESLNQSERIRSLKAVDQDSYNRIVEEGRTISTFIDCTERWFERFIAPLRQPLDVFYEAKRSVLDLAKADKKYCALEVGRYQDEQERIRRENERLAAVEQLRLQEEANLNAAIEAEAAGLKPSAVETILAAPNHAAAPLAPATYTKAQGVSGRKTWFAVPKDGLLDVAKVELCKAIAAGRLDLLPYIQENQSAMNKLASATTTAFNLPGWEAKYTVAGSFRKAAV